MFLGGELLASTTSSPGDSELEGLPVGQLAGLAAPRRRLLVFQGEDRVVVKLLVRAELEAAGAGILCCGPSRGVRMGAG